MDSSTCIEQKGVIKDISKGLAKVNITSFSACTHCHSKQACSILDTSNREISVAVSRTSSFAIGDAVGVSMKRTVGWKATILGYVIPFFLVLLTLLILNSMKLNEAIVGLGSLAVLVPYYIALYVNRENLKKSFSFSIRKIV